MALPFRGFFHIAFIFTSSSLLNSNYINELQHGYCREDQERTTETVEARMDRIMEQRDHNIGTKICLSKGIDVIFIPESCY